MASGPPKPILLWTASNTIKHMIGSRYLGYHFVWCSPVFDASAVARYTPGARQPPSSDPASIYRVLHADVKAGDRHSDAIERQRKSCKATALKLLAEGKLSGDQAAEVASIVDASQVSDWRPLIYAIPFELVNIRVQLVPVDQRASLEPEYIIPDLRDHEFHVIEPMPC